MNKFINMNLSPNHDLVNYFDAFRNVFLKQNSIKKNDHELLLFIEQIGKELEISQANEIHLSNNLKVFVENKDINITAKYTILEEKCSKIETENTCSKVQIDELNLEMKRVLDEQFNKYSVKIKELEEIHKSEIVNLKNTIESNKICFETKEQELCDEIQLAQARTALQCDEIESNLKRQLVDVTSKLRQSHNSTRALQLENTNLRCQLETQQKVNNDLRNRLLYFNDSSSINVIKNNLNNEATNRKLGIANVEDYFIDAHENQLPVRPLSRQSDFSDFKPSEMNNTYNYNVYNPPMKSNKELEQSAEHTSENIENVAFDRPNNRISESSIQIITKPDQAIYPEKEPSKNVKEPLPVSISYKNTIVSSKSDGYNKPVIYKGRINKKNMVPPLMPCSTNNSTKKNNQKKRKLYDPNNFDYLELLSNK